MSEHTVTHATFTLERTYPHAPAKVFKAFADQGSKRIWFADHEGWATEQYEMDFTVGGREAYRGKAPDGPLVSFDGEYQDIVPDERIVYTYRMRLDDNRISASLSTIQFEPADGGTRLTLTEQGAFLDDFDNPKLREEGTVELLDALGAHLDKQ